jgi:hypothetical protein
MSKKGLQPRWRTKAKILDDTYRLGAISTVSVEDLKIHETARSVDMDPLTEDEVEKEPYGVPISAKLGIALIADFQNLILPFLTKLKNAEFNKFISNELSEVLVDLLVRSSAITIDKNVLLKTISQPECEGVRFYLCRKEIEKNEQAQLKEGDKTAFVSLVTVGVDSEGCDLHYTYNTNTMDGGLLQASVSTTSLVSEYGSPPPPRTFNSIFDSFDERFVLLRFARDEVKKAREVEAGNKKTG